MPSQAQVTVQTSPLVSWPVTFLWAPSPLPTENSGEPENSPLQNIFHIFSFLHLFRAPRAWASFTSRRPVKLLRDLTAPRPAPHLMNRRTSTCLIFILRVTYVLFGAIAFALTPSQMLAQQPSVNTNGLVAFYRFDGDAKDSSGFNRNATTVSSVTYGTDRFGNQGKAATFVASKSSTVTIPSFPEANSDQISISLWVRPKEDRKNNH